MLRVSRRTILGCASCVQHHSLPVVEEWLQAILTIDADVFELVRNSKRVLVVLARVMEDEVAISLSDALIAHRLEHTVHLTSLLLRHQQILMLRLASCIRAEVPCYGHLLTLTHRLQIHLV